MLSGKKIFILGLLPFFAFSVPALDTSRSHDEAYPSRFAPKEPFSPYQHAFPGNSAAFPLPFPPFDDDWQDRLRTVEIYDPYGGKAPVTITLRRDDGPGHVLETRYTYDPTHAPDFLEDMFPSPGTP